MAWKYATKAVILEEVAKSGGFRHKEASEWSVDEISAYLLRYFGGTSLTCYRSARDIKLMYSVPPRGKQKACCKHPVLTSKVGLSSKPERQ